jgi:hypothetical protein
VGEYMCMERRAVHCCYSHLCTVLDRRLRVKRVA